jgi:heme-degrading monooxygenase HmoA
MYVIIWEYRLRPERVDEFEKIYGRNGAWSELFQQGSGYLGTELLRDSSDPYRYLTIDRWHSLSDYESFLSTWKTEYENLDAHCEGLTEQEASLGRWETISSEAR